MRKNVNLIIANSGWLLTERAVRMSIGVFVGAWVAKFLGPASFGEISYAVAYVAVIQTVASLGLDQLAVRDIARDVKNAGDILGTVFSLRLLAGLVSWLIGIVGLAVAKGLGDPYVLLSAILGVNLVFQAVDTVDLWFQSQLQSRRTVFAKFFAAILSNAVKMGLIYFRAPVYLFAAALVVEVAAGAGALTIGYRFFRTPERWRFNASRARSLISESWPFVVAASINMVQARVEFVMIESFLGAASLGQYAAAARFIEIFDIVFASIAVSIFPRIARQDRASSDAMMRRVYLVAVLTYIGIVPFLFVAWICIGLIYGPEYGPAKHIFPFMALRPLLAYVGIAKGIAIRVDSRSRYALLSSTVGALFAATAAYSLLPTYGLPGAVFASLASYVVSNLLIDAVLYRSNFSNFVYCWKEWPYFIGIMKGA